MRQREVTKFLSTMSRLGEPFIMAFGHADARLRPGWTTVGSATAAGVLDLDSDPIFAGYVFTLVTPAGIVGDLT